jgi:3-methyladenine DNA glycosylase/8-oxoguanine DNA glycosylase
VTAGSTFELHPIGPYYGLDREPSQEELGRRAELWRPYRTWASVLLRAFLEDQTGEVPGARPEAGAQSI